MCLFSAPSPPPPPPPPPVAVNAREQQAEEAARRQRERTSKRKGSRQFLSGRGFEGITSTLLGNVNDLTGTSVNDL